MRLGGLASALVVTTGLANAGFTNSFDGITKGSSVSLAWDEVQPEQYPLCLTAQLIDKGGEGFKANAYQVNITTGASGTSYLWTGAPYPLRWLPGGLYQLELRAASPAGEEAPLLAKSPFFSISNSAAGTVTTGSSSPQPTVVDSPGGGASGISKPVAIGVGVALGVPSVLATVVVLWCLRKRQRRAAMEKRQLKRSDFVIS